MKMTNPYPQYTQDNDFPWREYENPLYVAWEEGYEAARQEFVFFGPRLGIPTHFWDDWSGATHRVKILAETTDGRWVVLTFQGLGILLVKKEDITLAEEGE